ncbi:MAG TPA: heme-binding protein [Gaiellaceae bacterium]|jgi:hypothetical protein|nr:heme-binding protein [Gaiellaceae bacterium]
MRCRIRKQTEGPYGRLFVRRERSPGWKTPCRRKQRQSRSCRRRHQAFFPNGIARLNARRKAYAAARSDAASASELAAKVADDPVERASFDAFFTFFKGGVAAFEDGVRVGAVDVSGLPGDEDERLAHDAIARAGLSLR